MIEKIFNLFVYSDCDSINRVGVVSHEIEGTDDEKISFLQANVESDFANVIEYDLPRSILSNYNGLKKNGIEYRIFRDLCHKGQSLALFENAFIKLGAKQTPLVVLTIVKDGDIIIEGVEKFKRASGPYTDKIEVKTQEDWLFQYVDSSGFHLDKLINDDFFMAIRLLYNNGLYVSSMKLLMICIDTIAYLEYGDESRNFQNWINTYSTISEINITANELWEFRNSILHMTSLDSRKVKEGLETRLQFYISNSDTVYSDSSDEGKYFRFSDLISCIAKGIGQWGLSFNSDRQKIDTFINRYDRIISDSRQTYIYQKNTVAKTTLRFA